ncbi:hypothetical protein ACWCPF_44145 [Streptomyces sp. NPDC001858]
MYRTIAEARPTQADTDVAVNLGPLVDLCESAHTRVNAARAVPGRPLTECAADALADLGADFLAELQDGPAQAVRRAQELVDTGEFTVDQLDQILDEATDTAVLSGLLSLHEARLQSDPGTAAAKCLAATGHFALAVSVISVDVTDSYATSSAPVGSVEWAGPVDSVGTSRTISVSSPESMS